MNITLNASAAPSQCYGLNPFAVPCTAIKPQSPRCIPFRLVQSSRLLFHDAGDQTGGNCTATLTDVEALSSLSSDRVVEVEDHFHVVTGHDTAAHVAIGERKVASLI